ESGIVDTELPDQRIKWRHFGRIEWRYVHCLTRDENIEFIRIKDQFISPTAIKWLPEIKDIVLRLLVDIHHCRVVLAAITDQTVIVASEVNRQGDAATTHIRFL